MLNDLQALLGDIYALDVPANINDFLITDRRQMQSWQGAVQSVDSEEQLLIHQDDDELCMALYLDEELLKRLSAADPRTGLSADNLADFWTALEGISHFIYVAWNAAADKSVTRMELEMQAEVDKYVAARLLLDNQAPEFANTMYSLLFDDPQFHDDLPAEARARYRHASELASRYCHSLRTRYSTDRVGERMLHDLRTFYRLPQPAKVSHIHSATFQ